jgi:REP element-mobilizing transposase RayT
MARLAGIVAPGSPHHVTQRGNRRERVFFGDACALSRSRGAQAQGAK